MSDVANKWGETVAARGFAQIPNYLLLANQFLDPRLSPIELLVLLQLVGTWWRKDDLPFPSVATLAARCGVSGRQIQRAVGQLEKREMLKRVNRRAQGIIASNAYDLRPLADFLERIAKAFPNAFPRSQRTLKVKPTLRAAPVPQVPQSGLPPQAIGKPPKRRLLRPPSKTK